MGVPESEALQRPQALFLDLAQIRASEHERLRPKREQQKALYPDYESGDTGDSEWRYRRDTQRFMVVWVGDRPRWLDWLPAAAGAIPQSRMSRTPATPGHGGDYLGRTARSGEARSEAGRKSAGKRARQEDPSG